MADRELTDKDIRFFLKMANKKPSLSDWDITFIESIEGRVTRGDDLSEKQLEQLERIALS